MEQSEELRVTIVQTSLHWENAEKNRSHFDQILKSISTTDLVVLPEMFTTGFSMQPDSLYEEMNGASVQWMMNWAKKLNAVLTGSLIIRENSNYFNRLIWAQPDGTVMHYDKRHLFRMAGEHEHYNAGNQKIVPMLKGWRVCPLVCYDLRFPVWSRNTKPHNDLLLYVANWPEARRDPWMALLTARAIENQCYLVGVNRIGEDGKGIPHSGDSAVYDPKGNRISASQAHVECAETVVLSMKELRDFREKFPVLLDGDDFSVSTN
jgi:omega-amidase